MTYEEALDFIDKISVSGMKPGLERMVRLLDELAHPERACRIIHVAGTNGKGSVCTFIAAILQAAGYKVGRYISPTLYDYRERIQVNGQWIGKADVAACMAPVCEAAARLEADGVAEPTVFEAETAMAFIYFKKMNCDFVLLEAGMGGRMDATNVIGKPVLSVITAIGMDHMAYLGDTIAAIAREKGGIIKKGCPVVMDGSNEKAVQVLTDICRERGCPYRVMRPATLRLRASSLTEGQFFDYNEWPMLRTQMPGSYQTANAAVALEAVEQLRTMNGDSRANAGLRQCLTEDVIRKGIEAAWWPGRFEIIGRKPLIIADGAHNPDGARALAASIRQYLDGRRIILVMGVFADKDYGQMLLIMSEISDTLITFKPDQPRGLDAQKLADAAENDYDHIEAAISQSDAIQRALVLCGTEDVIISFGSLSTIAGLCDILKKIQD